jgi:hypothetical protein
MSVFTGKMEVAGISRENAMEASLKVSLGEHARPILLWSIQEILCFALDNSCCQHDVRGQSGGGYHGRHEFHHVNLDLSGYADSESDAAKSGTAQSHPHLSSFDPTTQAAPHPMALMLFRLSQVLSSWLCQESQTDISPRTRSSVGLVRLR